MGLLIALLTKIKLLVKKDKFKKVVFLKKKQIKIINKLDIEKLSKKKLLSTSRICLHKSDNDKHQEMVIWQKKGYYYPIKKNVISDQTFVILSGSLKILIFDKKGKILKSLILNKKNNLIVRIKKNTFFCDIAISANSIHFETKNSIFSKKNNIFANFKKKLKF